MKVAGIAGCLLTFVAGMFISAPRMQAAEVSRSVKGALFARYDQKNLTVTHDKMLVTVLNGSGSNTLDYAINYDHFYRSFNKSSWPKQYHRRNLIDEFTTEEVESSARFTDPLVIGEMLRVRKFYVRQNGNTLMIDFYLEALDGKRIARVQTIYADGGAGLQHAMAFGFHFRFYVPQCPPDLAESVYMQEVIRTIDQYMQPSEEYVTKAKATAAVQAQKNVEIKPGMTKAEVLSAVGEPQKSITFGEKTYLKYADFTVELVSDKVTDVKTD